MQDINKMDNQESNLGSVLQFEFLPVTMVEDVVILNGVIQSVVLPRDVKFWFKGYGPLESMRFNEPDADSGNGIKYMPVFSCNVPKDEDKNTGLFDEMRNQRFLVRYKDANGLKKLIGEFPRGLKFSSMLDTKQTVAGRNEYSIKFFGETAHRAMIYNY
jgi:hypothetical protein